MIETVAAEDLPDVGIDIELAGVEIDIGANEVGVVGLEIVHDDPFVFSNDVDDPFNAEFSAGRRGLVGEG